jgi:sulfoxide reductase catalytic subunit YedY
MLIKNKERVNSSEITDERIYLRRRKFMRDAAAGALALSAPMLLGTRNARAAISFENIQEGPYRSEEELTPYEDVTGYNNFYEFGTGKRDPARNAGDFRTEPWSIEVSGACEKPGKVGLEEFIKPHVLEDRVYKLRCVEAWSMIIPWVGVPLAPILKQFQPTSQAKYVAFKTLHDPEQMPGQKRGFLDWPYEEGLRIDEAMHPLTFFAVGLYGKVIPNQNGAPIRLVVPWKYGFKSIKSIVSVEFTEKQPATTWNLSAPREYGFYSNVNPLVDHPRWSQAMERRIGDFFKRQTEPFNGYADEVASLYTGMDLRENY